MLGLEPCLRDGTAALEYLNAADAKVAPLSSVERSIGKAKRVIDRRPK